MVESGDRSMLLLYLDCVFLERDMMRNKVDVILD